MDKQIEKAIVKHYGALYKRLGARGVSIIATRHAGGIILSDSFSLVVVGKTITQKLPWLHLVPAAGDVKFTKAGVEPWASAMGTLAYVWDRWSNADATRLTLTPFSIEGDGKVQVLLAPDGGMVLVPCKHLDMVSCAYVANKFERLTCDSKPVRMLLPGDVVAAIIMPTTVYGDADVTKFTVALKGAA